MRSTRLWLGIIILVLISQAHPIALSAERRQNLLLLTLTGLAKLDIKNGTLSYLPDQQSLLESPIGVTSSTADTLIYWFPHQLLTQGFWTVSTETEPHKVYIPFPASVIHDSAYDFAYTRWLLGKRYVLVEAGKHNPSPNVVGGIRNISSIWLMDMSTGVTIPWYWNCNVIIRLNSAGNQLATKCILDEKYVGKTPSIRYLTSDGIVDEIKEDYYVVYGPLEQSAFEPRWWFANDLSKIAYVDLSAGIGEQKIMYQSVAEKAPTSIEATSEFVMQLAWSPSGRYLVNFNQCEKLSTCVEIHDMTTNVVVWNSALLALSDRLYADDIVWLPDETGFFLLGLQAELLERYVWVVQFGRTSPILKWEVPSNTYHMILYH